MIPRAAEAVSASPESAVSLELPALRARMGDWTYYFALMKMSDLAARAVFPIPPHGEEAP